jgi:hypothetical protein
LKHVKLNFKTDKHLDIGWYSEIAGQRFHGQIEFVQMFKGALSPKQMTALAAVTWKDRPRSGEGGPYFTVDKRECGCGGSCTSNPIPGSKNAPETPRECILGLPQYTPADLDEGISENEWDKCKTDK